MMNGKIFLSRRLLLAGSAATAFSGGARGVFAQSRNIIRHIADGAAQLLALKRGDIGAEFGRSRAVCASIHRVGGNDPATPNEETT